ncbi:unnamed protein product [Caenorhabditis angaria]|uniref:Uncharacterized protein n=1 Tax=Caenorhabditis angaria TaxID=860376 RepID=A0A9P1IY77_9PELO|nr:unnamed protein product [Caenorhabditis angaria]
MDMIMEYGSIEDIPIYNCTGVSTFGKKRVTIGIVSMTYGTIMCILFLPCLRTMLLPDLFKLSCYKIMFYVGVVDVLALIMNSIFTGWLAYHGAVYCTYPEWIYLFGSAGLSLWCCSCLANILLLINRILHFKNQQLAEKVFGGQRTFVLLLAPTFYGLYFLFFTKPVLFTSVYYAWFFDPFIFQNRANDYINLLHSFNNIAIVILTCILYMYVGCMVIGEWKKTGTTVKKSNNILHQALVICALDQFSSTVYVAMNIIEMPEWTIVVAQYFWQSAHGFPVITYLTMNPTIRSRFFTIFLTRH